MLHVCIGGVAEFLLHGNEGINFFSNPKFVLRHVPSRDLGRKAPEIVIQKFLYMHFFLLHQFLNSSQLFVCQYERERERERETLARAFW